PARRPAGDRRDAARAAHPDPRPRAGRRAGDAGVELHRRRAHDAGALHARSAQPRMTVQAAVVARRDKLAADDEQRLRAALSAAGIGTESWFAVDKGKHAAQAATEALDDGATVVIVCGGDGTVRAAAGALVHRQAALAVVPCGTANLFAGALKLPKDPAEVIALVQHGERRTIDTGTCNGKPFIVMAG